MGMALQVDYSLSAYGQSGLRCVAVLVPLLKSSRKNKTVRHQTQLVRCLVRIEKHNSSRTRSVLFVLMVTVASVIQGVVCGFHMLLLHKEVVLLVSPIEVKQHVAVPPSAKVPKTTESI